MRLICGVDGCRGGWVVISKDLDTDAIFWRLYKNAWEIGHLESYPRVIAIDIPIGLPDRGSRACDLAARKLLGRGHASSVFPAPIRPVLAAADYQEACRLRFQTEGKKMSKQAWGITRKIHDVDNMLCQDTELQAIVHEVHPEVCFYFLAGQKPLQHNKKSKLGQAERLTLLKPVFGHWLPLALSQCRQLASAADDVLDAFAALWTAERIFKGESSIILPDPPKDSCGLRMEIVA